MLGNCDRDGQLQFGCDMDGQRGQHLKLRLVHRAILRKRVVGGHDYCHIDARYLDVGDDNGHRDPAADDE